MKKLALLLAVLLTLSLFACSSSEEKQNAEQVKGVDAEIVFVNVGKADACVVHIENYTAVIDTGTASHVPALLGVLNNMGVTKVDALFITHGHSDHAGGADMLCKLYDVDTLYYSSLSDKTDVYTSLADKTDKSVALSANDTVTVSDGIAFTVIGPVEKGDNENDNSLVLTLSVNGLTVLFAGDMQNAGEELLLDAGTDIKADILKVGNHGNPDATSSKFAKAVSPKLAVISTDTSVDTDSANEEVVGRFDKDSVLLTQDYAIGISVKTSYIGQYDVSAYETKQSTDTVSLKADYNAQSVALIGTANVDGWFLTAEQNDYILRLIGECKDVMTVSLRDDTLKKNDTVTLYDAYGNKVAVSAIAN